MWPKHEQAAHTVNDTMPKQRKTKKPRFSLFGYSLNQSRVQRALLAFATALVIFIALFARVRPEVVTYEVGDIADRTIKAERSASYIDSEETQKRREEAALSVSDVYEVDLAAEERAHQTVRDIITTAMRVRHDEEIADPLDQVELLRQGLDIQLSLETLRLLLQSPEGTLQRVEQTAAQLVTQAMSRQIRSNTDDLARVREEVGRHVEDTDLTDRYKGMVAEIVRVAIHPNLRYDHAATEVKRKEAHNKVAEVRRQISPGDTLIITGERVTQRHIDMFAALGLSKPRIDYIAALSLLGLVLGLMLFLLLYVRYFAIEAYNDTVSFVLLCAFMALAAILFSVTDGMGVYEIIVVSIATGTAIFLAIAINTSAAVGCVVFLAALAGVISPGVDARLMLSALICASLAVYAVRPLESRSSTVTRVAVVTAITNMIVVPLANLAFGYMVLWDYVLYAGLGGFISAVAASGLITVIEKPLGFTTSLRLLELQNPNEPLLKRLLTEAPGSYQSSVMVANIAEPAAELVGADPVLTRTAAMYHDIGKLKRPYFFIENQFGAENPHSRLSPHLSALVIISHVKEGMELAEEMKLPPEVAGVIPQSHGTTLASFMYNRALAQAEDGEVVRESDFRYPGPKPQTRENAIIMLADSVEAAAHAEANPTPERIAEIVDSIIEGKIRDGQLDEAPLTFKDIQLIKKSFVQTLTGMFHMRIPYPDETPQEQKARLKEEIIGEGSKKQ